MKKRVLKIAARVGIGLLVLILLAVAALNIYFPRYLLNKHSLGAPSENGDSFVVMSYNIRCWSVLDWGKKSWPYRADLVVGRIAEAAPDIIGFQEVTPGQYGYLRDVLAGYSSVIGYRDNSLFREGCPVFYNSTRYALIEEGSFWLSETPEVMSKDWGAAHYRICSYVVLEDLARGGRFVVFNTHLDHVSDEARIKGMGVVLNKISALGGMPAILMGDLNAEEDSETYAAATQSFADTKYAALQSMGGNTYHNWGAEMGGSPIDYILVSPGSFAVGQYAIDTSHVEGTYPSDHFPLWARLRLITAG